MTRVKCSMCGRGIESTTVTKKEYLKGDPIDVGCPYCGPVPLLAVKGKKKPKKKPVTPLEGAE